jgi:histidine ammonia-lyase
MPPATGSIQLDGHSLNLASIEAAARRGVPVTLTAEALQAVEASSRQVQQLAHGDRAVYGVNTGFGIFANRRVPPDELAELSQNLILSHAVGVGEPFPREVTRAAMIVRANTLAIGLSGVAARVLAALLELLNRDVTPAIPSQGSSDIRRDLAPPAHLVGDHGPASVPDS